MAYVVEDGTTVANANSYVTVEDFLNYWLDRNIDYSDSEPEQLQAALVAATDYIEQRFSLRWKGRQYEVDQALSWPRIGVVTREGIRYEYNEIPLKLKKAVMEYGKRALVKVLLPDPTVDPNVRRTEIHVGPIREIVQYAGGPAVDVFRPYPSADLWLGDLITGGSGVYK